MSNTQQRKSLQDRAKEFSVVLPFMEDKEKGELKRIVGPTVTINEYGFLHGDDGDYVAFTIVEEPDNFYFGSSVLTEQMQKLDTEGYGDDIRKEGLPVKFENRKSKNNRDYINSIFFPAS